MSRRSSIKSLPSDMKTAIDRAIREDRFTLDEILEAVREQFPDDKPPSRTALHRYRTGVESQMQAVRESREIADVWASKLGDAPESDIGKVVLEILRTLAYRTGSDLIGSGESIDARQISQLARAMQQIEDAGRIGVAREKAVRQAALDEVQRNIDKVAKDDGLSPDTIKAIRERIMGIAA